MSRSRNIQSIIGYGLPYVFVEKVKLTNSNSRKDDRSYFTNNVPSFIKNKFGKKGQKKKWERVLYGGTDFDAPTAYVNKTGFDGHIVLTDMCAPKPKPSKCQRMWMTDAQNARNPYFKTNERVIPIDH